jgi:hypothetical protein
MFSLVHEAVSTVMPVEQLRYIALSHVEADECGSLNEWLAVASQSLPLCGRVAALVSINDLADRLPRALADGETLSLGKHSVRWFDTPHLPHAWECGYLMEEQTRTLLCGDLFTQGGAGHPAVTESDILGPSEAFRQKMDLLLDSGVFCCLMLVDRESASRPEDSRSMWPPPGKLSPAGCAHVHRGVDAPHQPEHAIGPWSGPGASAMVKTLKRGRPWHTTVLSLRTTGPESRPSLKAV